MFQHEEEVTIEQIDFDWVSSCTSVKKLRQAQKVLKIDGNYTGSKFLICL